MVTSEMHDTRRRTRSVVLITGGGGAIGGACARRFAKAGSDVAIIDRNAEAGDSVAHDVRALGRTCSVFVGDAADYEASRALSFEVLRRFGHVDILVNVAGGGAPQGFLEMDSRSFHDVISQNLMSAWNWSHHLVPHMLERRDQRIINIASISAKHGGGPPATVSKSAYAAAKAAVLGLTRGLAKELAPNITVNAVCPGLIATSNTSRIVDGPDRDAILASIPMGRVGQPDDVAAAVCFLASPDAGWITGEVMDVNGGEYID